MTKQAQIDAPAIIVFGRLYTNLAQDDIIDRDTGKPKKTYNLVEEDMVFLYKWARDRLPSDTTNAYKIEEDFNNFVQTHHGDALVNNMAITMKLIDNMMVDMPKSAQLVVLPKVTRVIREIRESQGLEITQESLKAGTSIYKEFFCK